MILKIGVALKIIISIRFSVKIITVQYRHYRTTEFEAKYGFRSLPTWPIWITLRIMKIILKNNAAEKMYQSVSWLLPLGITIGNTFLCDIRRSFQCGMFFVFWGFFSGWFSVSYFYTDCVDRHVDLKIYNFLFSYNLYCLFWISLELQLMLCSA